MGIHDDCFEVYSIPSIMRRISTLLLDSVLLLPHRCLRLSCFTSMDAFVPRVLKFCVASSPAVSEPRTATSAAAEFAGFRDGATSEAHGTDERRRGG